MGGAQRSGGGPALKFLRLDVRGRTILSDVFAVVIFLPGDACEYLNGVDRWETGVGDSGPRGSYTSTATQELESSFCFRFIVAPFCTIQDKPSLQGKALKVNGRGF